MNFNYMEIQQSNYQVFSVNIKLIAIFVIILAIGIGFYLYSSNVPQVQKATCGNGICEASEDCNSCPADCGCKQGMSCASNGICRTTVCGDGICTTEKNQSGNCCEDCGCPSNQICNKFTEQCQVKATITDTQINGIVKNYLLNNSITGTVTKIVDAYYANATVKQVTIDCSTQNQPYPCQINLFIDNSGNIVKEEKTT
jgi:hypothetical protein